MCGVKGGWWTQIAGCWCYCYEDASKESGCWHLRVENSTWRVDEEKMDVDEELAPLNHHLSRSMYCVMKSPTLAEAED